MKYLLSLLLILPILSYAQSIECPPGHIRVKDKNGHWKCESIEPLPVKLLYFKGVQVNDSVQLYWSTASEINNDYFIIEGSNDAVRFTPIVKQHSDYTTADFQQYYSKKVKGYKYYRLIQVDFNNTREYFPIIYVYFNPIVKPSANYDVIGRQIKLSK